MSNTITFLLRVRVRLLNRSFILLWEYTRDFLLNSYSHIKSKKWVRLYILLRVWVTLVSRILILLWLWVRSIYVRTSKKWVLTSYSFRHKLLISYLFRHILVGLGYTNVSTRSSIGSTTGRGGTTGTARSSMASTSFLLVDIVVPQHLLPYDEEEEEEEDVLVVEEAEEAPSTVTAV